MRRRFIRDTRDALEAVRARGEKAIVLLNRRGWSNFLSCRGCGRVWECPRCDVTLVLHRASITWHERLPHPPSRGTKGSSTHHPHRRCGGTITFSPP